MTADFRHFYQKNWAERTAIVTQQAHLTPAEQALFKQYYLPQHHEIIENYLTDYPLPMGLAVNFVVDGVNRIVPMVTEEPSVIAAASNGAKIVKRAGGFTTVLNQREMIGQIVLEHLSDPAATAQIIEQHTETLLKVADAAHPSLKRRGGGARRLRTRILGQGYLSIDLFVDVQAAMGANMLNSMLEAVAKSIGVMTKQNALMSILSNYATASLVKAICDIPVGLLQAGRYSGELVAQKIAAASTVAQLDPYRATTHNKGIMNGIDAVAIASGNDWRALESGAHAYAAKDGQYRGMSTWTTNGQTLHGELEVPMPVGIVGGSIKINELAQLNQRLLGIQTAGDLERIIVAVGLAQNLAALRALVTTGIQQGHMHLQLKSLAMAAGATPAELPTVLQRLELAPQQDLATTQQLIADLRQIKEETDD
ncbi:hydroxymethylglutaryl-CoA reductase, degradative [Lactiplantibacillus paraplantarum]|uniref:3-hydroxy-3-methylglutaryl coenzyme A reductase n=1 Tax=Lactiplantibacillus paraplantarum TaxID=60520 RepID=A0AAD0X723_9LACO|nr:hydroxymethylglutaryl-CoA reductase, degradative [Lactiplantibacillus paraplantarum]AYJ37656.1 hydroxymethylglutaryl-CoA reductase, degradative [Lactiplantibacillus paraplantarum]ERL43654.1 hydroxymethylglutaryl-CoA reductase [Lactiplantibacillus paraplantarum]KRL50938.1 hydroxymethylglutaryl-CoA reductase [Lactiplantibacillus paraplantarum DSM 10667]MCU4682607.1 hydroxymethylglutaryl-CoA reductase, degradative [Lactiplantibacillus paraplantarum]MDL2060632.1 hydroxymethylglutaryl-CoA reduct